ncbi:hypothetical protein Sjap_024325 [Stephania japonica]|uniref:Nucleoside phosphorylase domain-containing protein n=1 Tax=Stephania japonica TaxID=461633 RepID=A0AAP0EKG0_9MAGN
MEKTGETRENLRGLLLGRGERDAVELLLQSYLCYHVDQRIDLKLQLGLFDQVPDMWISYRLETRNVESDGNYGGGVRGAAVTKETLGEIMKINEEDERRWHSSISVSKGRRFRIGKLENEKVIVVMIGLAMVRLATELLLSLFEVKGVAHNGIAGNGNPNLQIGDVVRLILVFGIGRDMGMVMKMSWLLKLMEITQEKLDTTHVLEIFPADGKNFPVDGEPEIRQHTFWVPVENHYLEVAQKIEGLELERSVNSSTCLTRKPMVVTVEKGSSASVLVDNAAYRSFTYSKFNVTPIDKTPFITFRALSNLAGGGSSSSNEVAIFSSLAA